MKILGIGGSLIYENHDAAAALIIDGKLVCNYEEERLNRIKHSVHKSFPILAINKIFNETSLTINDIDLIVMPFDPFNKQSFIKKLAKRLNIKKEIPVIYPGHHIAHICDSFFQSGFKSAAALIVDGQGDQKDGITLAHIKEDNIKILKVYDAQKSLGVLYSAASNILKLGEFGEGKLMGLSSYGIPNQPVPLSWKNNDIECKHLFGILKNNVELYDTACGEYLKKYCFPYREFESKSSDNIMYYVNIAASVQNCYNDIFMHLIQYLKELTNEDNLILSGGCIQNCIGNNLVVESKIFKNVFAGPAPHDAGTAAGLAFYGAFINKEKIENIRLKNSYTGISYTDNEILKACYNYKVTKYDYKEIVQQLATNKIIAWFQGGSEIGPRALGHRSILANPKTRKNLFTINNYIKQRENWRPLAPVVPAELFDMIFDVSSYDLTEFMLRTIKIKDEWQKKLSAVCHIDCTTRPQRLEREQNPELYDLIMNFYKETGIPCLINTSFNGRNEPIIETPEQAIKFFKKKKYLDYVIFNSKYVVSR